MKRNLVLDTTVTLPWLFGDLARAETDALLEALGAGAVAWVPAHWHQELAQVLLGAQRQGRLDQAGTEAFLAYLQEFEIHLDEHTADRAWSKCLGLATQYQLSVYDAAYLELALRLDLPLATLDPALTQAANKAGVALALG